MHKKFSLKYSFMIQFDFACLQIPKGFPYFAVDFGMQGGFAHVIEDERQFPKYFGKVCRA